MQLLLALVLILFGSRPEYRGIVEEVKPLLDADAQKTLEEAGRIAAAFGNLSGAEPPQAVPAPPAAGYPLKPISNIAPEPALAALRSAL